MASSPSSSDSSAPVARLPIARWNESGELRQIVAGEPELVGHRWFNVEEEHPLAGHPPKLAQPGLAVAPVVIADNRHRCIEGPIGERQGLSAGLEDASGAGRALGDHHAGRLDCRHVEVGRLVRSRAGTHVEDRDAASQRMLDACRDTWVRAADACIADTEFVVQDGHVDAPSTPICSIGTSSHPAASREAWRPTWRIVRVPMNTPRSRLRSTAYHIVEASPGPRMACHGSAGCSSGPTTPASMS